MAQTRKLTNQVVDQPKKEKSKPSASKVGIHEELEVRGFGFLQGFMNPHGCYVRITVIARGVTPAEKRMCVEVVTTNTKLWPKSAPEKPKTVWRWWKNDQGKSDTRNLMLHLASVGEDRTFVINGLDELIPKSQRLLKRL